MWWSSTSMITSACFTLLAAGSGGCGMWVWLGGCVLFGSRGVGRGRWMYLCWITWVCASLPPFLPPSLPPSLPPYKVASRWTPLVQCLLWSLCTQWTSKNYLNTRWMDISCLRYSSISYNTIAFIWIHCFDKQPSSVDIMPPLVEVIPYVCTLYSTRVGCPPFHYNHVMDCTVPLGQDCIWNHWTGCYGDWHIWSPSIPDTKSQHVTYHSNITRIGRVLITVKLTNYFWQPLCSIPLLWRCSLILHDHIQFVVLLFCHLLVLKQQRSHDCHVTRSGRIVKRVNPYETSLDSQVCSHDNAIVSCCMNKVNLTHTLVRLWIGN